MNALCTRRVLIDAIIIFVSTFVIYYKAHKNENILEEEVVRAKFNEDQQNELFKISRKLVELGKGILAADESISTMGKRFATIQVENTAERRRKYRNLLFTTPNISQYISGIILCEETYHQKDDSGRRFVDIIREAGMLAGIKLDEGLKLVDGTTEYITVGLNDLAKRAAHFKEGGCQFAKWRSVFVVSNVTPSRKVLQENVKILAQYAVVSQQAGLVPIIEPEVLADGEHNLEKTQIVTEQVLAEVYKSLHDHGVYLEGTLLKPNMVVSGSHSFEKVSHDKIAHATLQALLRTVPAAVPGIVFLSGGQLEADASRNLNAINKISLNKPWKLSFSYGRALQTSALKKWITNGEKEAQDAFFHRSKLNHLAAKGRYVDEFG